VIEVLELLVLIKVMARVLDNAHKPAKDIHILVDNGMVNASVEIVAMIDVVNILVGVTARGHLLEVREIVYMNIKKK